MTLERVLKPQRAQGDAGTRWRASGEYLGFRARAQYRYGKRSELYNTLLTTWVQVKELR
jgi:hypothetical protein